MTDGPNRENDQWDTQPGRPDTDPIAVLQAFHGRIRAALRMLNDLAEHPTSALEPSVAEHLIEFFTGPLAWHDLDEETTLIPLLRAIPSPPPGLMDAVATVSGQHTQMESLVENLLVDLGAVAAGQPRPVPDPFPLAAQAFRETFEPHLELEERELFPAARLLLAPEALREIADDLRSRALMRRAVPAAGQLATNLEQEPADTLLGQDPARSGDPE